MGINDKYTLAVEELDATVRKRVERGVYVAMGYTSNLDLLADFQIDILNTYLAQYLPGATSSSISVPRMIHSMEDLLNAIVFFCMHGIGGEVDLANTEIMDEVFTWKHGMGGTGVQAAMALAAIKCPTIVHLTDDSKEVCDILSSPFIHSVSRDGILVHTEEIESTEEQEIHYIIQFRKGEVIKLGEEEITIPASNRLIITHITVNEHVPLSKPYFQYIEDNALLIGSNVLSSFNAILDEKVLAERLEYVKGHVRRYKEKNSLGIVFLEEAHYHSESIRKLCLETIYPHVDIVSLNEEELENTLRLYGFPIDIGDTVSTVEGARFIKNEFGVNKGVIVHTKDYSMYVGDNLIFDIERGLMYGNLIATAKARHGSYGTAEQIRALLELPLSERGLEAYRTVSERYRDSGKVVVVPTKYIDKPAYTIGLGDSFVAGVQLCF